MSEYVSVASQSRKALAAVARLEQEIERHPDQPALLVNLAARQKAAQRLRDRLENVAIIEKIELCNYRLVSEHREKFLLPYVAGSLLEYQNVFSQTYDALKNGPKRRTNLGAEVKSETALEFAYSYAGSLGVVLMAPSSRDFFEGKFDQAIEAMYQLLDVDEAHTVRDIAQLLGGAVVKRLYDWSKANVGGLFDVDVKWARSDGRHLGRVYRCRDAERVISVIDATSEEEEIPREELGILIGGDLSTRTFHFVVPNGGDYRGKLSQGFPEHISLELGARYVARMTEYVTLHYARNEETRRYELNFLSDPKTD